jgi:hypothetical protein
MALRAILQITFVRLRRNLVSLSLRLSGERETGHAAFNALPLEYSRICQTTGISSAKLEGLFGD